MKKIFLIALIICLTGAKAHSQGHYTLSLEQSIEIAKEQSLQMLALRENLNIAESNLTYATSRLKTNINMSLTLPKYDKTVIERADSTGIFRDVKELTYSGQLNISQPLPTDGSIYIRSQLGSYLNYNSDQWSGNIRTRIGFSQPLDALYGYSAIRTELKSAKLDYESANKSYKRAELALITSVSQYYYSLLSQQKRVEIALLDLERQAEAYEISKNKYESGLIKEVDALQMEVDLASAQSSYDMAVLSQENSLNEFKNVMGIELDAKVTLIDNLSSYELLQVDPDEAVRLALENRSEIREYEINIEKQKMNIKRQQVQGYVRGNLDAYYERVGIMSPTQGENVGSSLENSWTNLIDRPSNFGVGLTITVPILDWGGNRAQVRARKAELRRQEYYLADSEREIEIEVRNLISQLNSSYKSLQLWEKNVIVAEKSFEITRQRYSDGDIDSQSLALERNRLNSTHTSHLDAYISYQNAIVRLMQATFYDFRTNTLVE